MVIPGSTGSDDENDFNNQTEPVHHLSRSNEETQNASGQHLTWNGSGGWEVYFPDQPETHASCAKRAKAVNDLKRYLLTDEGQSILSAIPTTGFTLPLDYATISETNAPPELRTLAKELQPNPDEALATLGLAAARAAELLAASSIQPVHLAITRENRLWPRLYNFNPLTALRGLRGNSVGRFVAVRGTVVRVSNIRQQLVSMQFECARCGENQLRVFSDYKYSAPTRCTTDRCRSKSFQPIRDTAETVDWQKIRIQELREIEDELQEEGRMPRTIDAELFSDLIDTCIPGDVVTICGIVRILTVQKAGFNRNASCLYYIYIEANSTTTTRSRDSVGGRSSSGVSNPVEEPAVLAIHRVIREVTQEKDPFAFLVHSAAPSIYGHELVKAGMVLSLFGGSPKERVGPAGSESVAIRRDIHCLIVGDPGLGKSQMLKSVANVAPRGVYVCGNSTSTAGLTVTVVREATGDFALEAGALVLGDRGVCCIDEFDKMRAEHGALLEAMEQQSVSVAKAGLICNLSARTTVIAAANPVGGHYDRSRTVCENLKIALPLLSRFDLVFILMDKSDAARDRFISEHVMKIFGMRSPGRSNGGRWREDVSATAREEPSIPNRDEDLPLVHRLREMKVTDPLPPSLFREYIQYARRHVQAELSEGAKEELQDFYLHLRKTSQEQAADTTPITTRQLESLIRLSEARARAEMRTVVTRQDARDVIEIMRESMIETLTDETGVLDLGRASGMSRHKDAKRFVAALHAEAKRRREAIFDRKGLKAVAERIGIEGERFERLIETVNHQGYIVKKGVRLWEVQGSSFADGVNNSQARSSTAQRLTQRAMTQMHDLSQHSIARRYHDRENISFTNRTPGDDDN